MNIYRYKLSAIQSSTKLKWNFKWIFTLPQKNSKITAFELVDGNSYIFWGDSTVFPIISNQFERCNFWVFLQQIHSKIVAFQSPKLKKKKASQLKSLQKRSIHSFIHFTLIRITDIFCGTCKIRGTHKYQISNIPKEWIWIII